jgi:hypothetical protein
MFDTPGLDDTDDYTPEVFESRGSVLLFSRAVLRVECSVLLLRELGCHLIVERDRQRETDRERERDT